MKPFKFTRATDAAQAVKEVSANKEAKFLAGGSNLLDLMKEGVENPAQIVDISKLALSQIQTLKTGGVSIGALAKNSDTANHPLIRQNYPLLSQAILSGASAQIRNMATNGGNLLQRTRCAYFYDTAMPCNKRNPGSGCAAAEGFNRYHAILGASANCVATHPSDMCVALAALDANVRIRGANGAERVVKFTDFHRLPENTPEKDNNLAHGELITAIELPKISPASKFFYLKIRDRASYAFALISVAVLFESKGGIITNARIALGGVAHKPWRAVEAEMMLNGKVANEKLFREAAEAALKNAKPLEHNAYKVELAKRAIVRAMQKAMNAV